MSVLQELGPEPDLGSLGAVERNGQGWAFTLNCAHPDLVARIEYRNEDLAARARVALANVLDGATVSLLRKKEETQTQSVRSPKRPTAAASPAPSIRPWMYALLEEGQLESLAGRVIEFFLISLIVANVAAVALETIPSVNVRFRSAFTAFEEFSLAAYTLEYVLRVWASVEDPRIASRGPVGGRIAFVLRPLMIIDFLAFAPSYLGIFFGFDLRVLRIFRLFRLLKLARYSQALQALFGVLIAERSALFASVILLLSTMCLEGELMHLVEGSIQPDKLGTMPNAMYWALATLTTVGYGDITPVTPLGKVIAMTTMVTGLALFALPVGIIANGFVTGLSRRRFAINWTMLRRQPLFAGFDVDALNNVMETARATVMREHAHVTVSGREAQEFYLVVSGAARVEYADGIREIGPGDMIGEEALRLSSTYRSTTTAQTDIRLIVFSGDELRRIARKFPLVGERISQQLALHDLHDEASDPGLKLKQLEDENLRLRKALSDLVLAKLVPGN